VWPLWGCVEPAIGQLLQILFASGFDCRNFRKIERQFIRWKGLNVHLDQTDKGATKVRFGFAASIDNHANSDYDASPRTDDVDCFLHAATTCHDIFDNDESFTS
jgi:hypothetical protein